MSDKVTLRDLFDQNEKILAKVEKGYVTKMEFLPIKLLVYGATAAILTKVVSTGLGYLTANVDLITLAKENGRIQCVDCHQAFHELHVGSAGEIGMSEKGNKKAIEILEKTERGIYADNSH